MRRLLHLVYRGIGVNKIGVEAIPTFVSNPISAPLGIESILADVTARSVGVNSNLCYDSVAIFLRAQSNALVLGILVCLENDLLSSIWKLCFASFLEVWQDLPLRKKCDIIREIVEVERKMLSISSTKYGPQWSNRSAAIMTYISDRLGSLYFRDSGVTGCEPAIVTAGPKEVIDRIESQFCVGPITRREFWDKERCGLNYHGPCKS
jgi:hypothetical protein